MKKEQSQRREKEDVDIQIDLRSLKETTNGSIETSDTTNTSNATEGGDIELSVRRENLGGVRIGRYDAGSPFEERMNALVELVNTQGGNEIPEEDRLDILSALKKIEEYDFDGRVREFAGGMRASIELRGSYAPFIVEWNRQREEHNKNVAEQKKKEEAGEKTGQIAEDDKGDKNAEQGKEGEASGYGAYM